MMAAAESQDADRRTQRLETVRKARQAVDGLEAELDKFSDYLDQLLAEAREQSPKRKGWL